jgi:O-antigen/teichoic acid export membrane protein
MSILNANMLNMSPKSRSKKASLNTFTSILDYAVRVGVEFVTTPLLLAGLGTYLFGLWRILWRLNGYMDAAGGRSAQALKWIVAQNQLLPNYDEKRRYIGGTIVVWLLFLPLLLLLGGLLIWLAPVLLKVPDEYLWVTQLTIGIIALNVIATGLVDIPKAVLQGENLGYKRIGLSTFLVLIGGVLMLLAMYFELGLAGVASATLITTLLTGIMFLRVVGSHVSWFGIAKPDRETVRWLTGLSGWFVVWKVVSQLMLAGDIVILGIFDSVELVSTYTFTKYVPETLIKLITIVVFGVSPGLGGIIGLGDMAKASDVRNEIMSFTWLLLTVAGAVILLWNGVFVQLWVGSNVYAGVLPTLLVIMLVAQITLIRNDANIIDLTLNIRTKAILGVISELLALSLAALLVKHYHLGILGVCAGCIAGRSVISVAYPLVVSRYLGISFYSQLKSLLRPIFFTSILFTAILAGINYEDFFIFEKLSMYFGFTDESIIKLDKLSAWLNLNFNSPTIFKTLNTWPGLVLGATVTTFMMLVMAFYGGLSGIQRGRLLKRVREIVK